MVLGTFRLKPFFRFIIDHLPSRLYTWFKKKPLSMTIEQLKDLKERLVALGRYL
jgi:hypothetical protein